MLMHATLAVGRVQAIRAVAAYALPCYPCTLRRDLITVCAAHSIDHVRHRSAVKRHAAQQRSWLTPTATRMAAHLVRFEESTIGGRSDRERALSLRKTAAVGSPARNPDTYAGRTSLTSIARERDQPPTDQRAEPANRGEDGVTGQVSTRCILE